ncbi:MAG: DUF4175 family protein [Chitinophagales bacterium]|nr:DUF4175 family protein [Chitinophagales bacterium]MDW8418489.1 DUF4175 family protein [Chitinophagales bacterium]
MNVSGTYLQLIEKLDRFIRKYYINEMIRGSIFTAIYTLALFITVNVLEYYLYLPPLWRKVLFYGFILSTAAVAARFVALPLLHYYKLGKIISYDRAAQIIGAHFTEVRDKLLNLLQLGNRASAGESQLLLAAIDQKASELKPVDFSFAIDLSKNKRYLKYLAPPALLLLAIIIAAPNVITDGTKRLYYNDTYFEKQAPFRFVVLNPSLTALQGDDFTLEVSTEGDALPAEMELENIETGVKLLLRRKATNHFVHDFTNLEQTLRFRLYANGYYSKEMTLRVLSRPAITGFEVSCDYPAYTGKPDEVIKNMGDLVVPAGTKLTWRFNTKSATRVALVMGDSAYTAKPTGTGEFIFSKVFMQGLPYTVAVSGSEAGQTDSATYSLQVLPDLPPVIAVKEKNDSVATKYFYYIGEVSDDYGIRSLTFHYQITREDSLEPSAPQRIPVPFTPGTSSRFTHYWSLSDFNIRPGDKISYYFEVCDNDGIRGSKCTQSEMMYFAMPSLHQLNREMAEESKALKEELKDAMKNARQLQEELRQMKEKMLEKQNLNWEDKKNLQNAIDKQQQLHEQIKEIQEKMKQNFGRQEEFKEISESIREKQKNLQELADKVLDQETKNLLDKLRKMLEELQKKDAIEKTDEMKNTSENLEKELDRMLELFKKMEFAQKLEETAAKLEKLAEKQDELAKQTGQNTDPKTGAPKDAQLQKQLQEQQQKLNQALRETQNDMNDLKKMNEETRSRQDFSPIEQSINNAERQQEDASEQMNNQQNQNASQNQKSAANNMRNAAQKMKEMKSAMESEEAAEDMQAIRQLLENIVTLSFDQEKLMAAVKATNINTPKYVDLMREQQRIRENSRMVEDTLYAIAKRQESIKSFVTKEIKNINKYLDRSIDDLEDRNVARAAAHQQFVMTGYNNLALMLSEALQQMQMEQSERDQQQSGQQKMCMKCKKPGKGMPSLSNMQKQLKDKMSQVAEMMKREGNRPGKNDTKGNPMSKEFAEMARMQQQIRKELERIAKEENKDGRNSNSGNLAQTIKQMEETEKNLVNKQLTAEMLKRQQEIMNKLLEYENAQRLREMQPERESNSGKELERKIPPSLEEYLRARQSEVDFYKTVPPTLRPYYKQLTEDYFRKILTK